MQTVRPVPKRRLGRERVRGFRRLGARPESRTHQRSAASRRPLAENRGIDAPGVTSSVTHHRVATGVWRFERWFSTGPKVQRAHESSVRARIGKATVKALGYGSNAQPGARVIDARSTPAPTRSAAANLSSQWLAIAVAVHWHAPC